MPDPARFCPRVVCEVRRNGTRGVPGSPRPVHSGSPGRPQSQRPGCLHGRPLPSGWPTLQDLAPLCHFADRSLRRPGGSPRVCRTRRQGGCVSFSRDGVFRRHASVERSQESAGVFLGVSVSSSVLVLRSRPVLITTCTSNFSFYFFINNKSKMKRKTQLSNFLSAEELFLQTRSNQKSQSVQEPNEGGSGPSGARCQVWWPPSSFQGRWPQGARTPGQRGAGPGPPHAAGPSARDAMATPGRQPRPLQSEPPAPGSAPCPPSSSQARTISHQPACQIRGHITAQSK